MTGLGAPRLCLIPALLAFSLWNGATACPLPYQMEQGFSMPIRIGTRADPQLRLGIVSVLRHAWVYRGVTGRCLKSYIGQLLAT